MVFDPTQPVAGTNPASEPIRENFLQIAVHHRGTTEPPAKTEGFVWWDASDSENEKLRAYVDGSWRDLFHHMESTPVPAAGGGVSTFVGLSDTPADYSGAGGQFVKVKSGADGLEFGTGGGGSSPLPTTITREFEFTISVDDLVEGQVPLKMSTPSGSGVLIEVCRFPGAGIVETGPVIASDPDDVVDTASFETDASGGRQLRVTYNDGNIAISPLTSTFQITWTWNGVAYTLDVTVSVVALQPVLQNIDPVTGSQDDPFTIFGEGFGAIGQIEVKFGANIAMVTDVQPDNVSGYIPSGSGTVTVRVTNKLGGLYDELVDGFTYI